jgi:hypothetical protein
MNSEQVIESIRHLYNTYGKQTITSDKRLLLLYWKDIDGVEMTKEHFSTGDWLKKSTAAEVIINGKMLLECKYGR